MSNVDKALGKAKVKRGHPYGMLVYFVVFIDCLFVSDTSLVPSNTTSE
jgi:hypothetical protein